jgi:hypothetical protein
VIKTTTDGFVRDLDEGSYIVCEPSVDDNMGFETCGCKGAAFTIEGGTVAGAAFHGAQGYEAYAADTVSPCGTQRTDLEDCLQVADPTPWIP